jgi:hypothetical protein
MLVAHTCNTVYSGGKDQENHSVKPAPVNSSQDPFFKITKTVKGWWSHSGSRVSAKQAWSPEFKTTTKKNFFQISHKIKYQNPICSACYYLNCANGYVCIICLNSSFCMLQMDTFQHLEIQVLARNCLRAHWIFVMYFTYVCRMLG